MARKQLTPEERKRRAMERATSALTAFTDMIETGDFPAQLGRAALISLHSDAPSAKWSAGNQLLMLRQGTTDARGYKQWQAAGRQVKRGAKALYIFHPRTIKTETDEETGEEKQKTLVIGFGALPVFAIEDTEGEPVPGYEPPTLPPLVDVAEEWGISVKYAPGISGHYYGYYSPGQKSIVLCTHNEATFFHELAHVAHDRLGKLTERGQDKRQEIVAETAAAALCHLYGYSGYEVAARDYIAHYAKSKDDPQATVREIMRYAGEVRDVVTLILTTAEEITGKTAAA